MPQPAAWPPPQLPAVPMATGAPPEEGTVAVVVRVRPLAPGERGRAEHPILCVVDRQVVVFDPEEPSDPFDSVLPTSRPRHQGKNLKFFFDRVFGETATQEEVFQHTTLGILDSIFDGYNCSVFAYGATGAGKTYTMLGSEKSPGIMYLTMVELYRMIEARKEEKSCEVLITYQEVYNEQIYDLLEPRGPLAIREDPEKGVVVQGLSFHQPKSAEQLLEMLANGNKNRTQHPTDANATSSRSHAIFQIYVKQQDRVGDLAGKLQVAKMSLIDLAGSERASVTNAKGERLREGANINRSLLALINVINALADTKSKKTHIPYRDSKLTHLLKDSIGGNCRTVMIAAVSPSLPAYEDTYNTLKYANRAKEIKMLLKRNVLAVDCHSSACAAMREQLKAEVANLQAKLRAYEDAALEAKNQALALPAPLDSSQVGLPRSEEAVPKTSLALDGQRESGGEQQELKAEWPVQLQLELKKEDLEEMPPSSSRATHQTDLQLEPKKPSCLLQGLSGSRTETLVAAVLRVARKQHSLLKDASLLTPDMVSEFEELEHLVHQETGVSLEQATSVNRPVEVRESTSVWKRQLDCDAEASVAVPGAPMVSATLQCLEKILPFCSPTSVAPSPIRKRKRTEMNYGSQLETPCSLKTQMKWQQGGGKEAETPSMLQSPDTSCLKATPQAAPAICPLPLPLCCLLTVAKSRVPLAMSTAPHDSSEPALPVRNLNVTFVVRENVTSPDPTLPAVILPEFSVPENVQSLNKQDGPVMPNSAKSGDKAEDAQPGGQACVNRWKRSYFPVSVKRISSMPSTSLISKPPAEKRRRVKSTNSSSLGGLQRQTVQLPSSRQRPAELSHIPASKRPSSSAAWKGSKRTTKALAAPRSGPSTSTF